jgi:hypothetical protein
MLFTYSIIAREELQRTTAFIEETGLAI